VQHKVEGLFERKNVLRSQYASKTWSMVQGQKQEMIYVGENPLEPKLGDYRVYWRSTWLPQEITIFAKLQKPAAWQFGGPDRACDAGGVEQYIPRKVQRKGCFGEESHATDAEEPHVLDACCHALCPCGASCMHSDVCGLLQKCFGPSQTSTDVVAESTPSHKIAGVLGSMPPDEAAMLLSSMDRVKAGAAMAGLDCEPAAQILEYTRAAKAASLLDQLERTKPGAAAGILDLMQPTAAAPVRQNMQGNEQHIEFVLVGRLELPDIITTMKQGDRFRTILLRCGGFVLILLALCLILEPVPKLFGFIPFVGTTASSLVRLSLFLVAFILGCTCVGVTASVAWFRSHPVLSIGLTLAFLGSAFIILYFGHM